MVIRAIDSGWSGPPFDPIALADLLSIDVVPTNEIRDARTVPIGKGRVRIEFNPNRPRGRMRYSLAHEIAHTLFPDCAERVQNRAGHDEFVGDDWQLEALCNIAAAELLIPIGTLDALDARLPVVEALLEERKRFDVSTEALFIRAARVTDEPVATFCASRIENGRSAGRYRLDYLIGSRTWSGEEWSRRPDLLPPETAVAHCSGIGFTARAEEAWGGVRQGSKLHLECVGIPPYPGAHSPRVIGILWSADLDPGAAAVPFISAVRGDATQPRGKDVRIIVQVVNDATPNWGGAGFASAIRRVFPQVQDDFKDWWSAIPRGTKRLGQTRIVRAADGIWVASVVAQHGYGPSPKPRIRYAALRQGLERVASSAIEIGATLHMPRIGCGQAGGSWPVVEELLRETVVAAGARITVYDPPGAQPPSASHAPEPLDLFVEHGA